MTFFEITNEGAEVFFGKYYRRANTFFYDFFRKFFRNPHLLPFYKEIIEITVFHDFIMVSQVICRYILATPPLHPFFTAK